MCPHHSFHLTEQSEDASVLKMLTGYPSLHPARAPAQLVLSPSMGSLQPPNPSCLQKAAQDKEESLSLSFMSLAVLRNLGANLPQGRLR